MRKRSSKANCQRLDLNQRPRAYEVQSQKLIYIASLNSG